MKQLTKKEVQDIWEEYLIAKKDDAMPKIMYPAMVYNFLITHGTVIYLDKQNVLDQATEIEELAYNNDLRKYKNLDPVYYDKLIKQGIKQDNIKYEAKRLAVRNYFEWLIKNGKQLFTDYE